MRNPIIAEANLEQISQRVWDFAIQHRKSYSIDLDDSSYGRAFATFVFFSRFPAFSSVLGKELDATDRFYNAYFWFLRFESLYTRKNGYDAGLKDQISDMLAQNAHLDLDPQVIEAIEGVATKPPTFA